MEFKREMEIRRILNSSGPDKMVPSEAFKELFVGYRSEMIRASELAEVLVPFVKYHRESLDIGKTEGDPVSAYVRNMTSWVEAAERVLAGQRARKNKLA